MEDGDGKTDPLIPHTEDNDYDDNRDNTTEPFQPEAASIPRPSGESHSMTTMNRPPEHGPHTAETSFIEGTYDTSGIPTKEDMVLDEVKNDFPFAKEILEASNSKKGKLQVKIWDTDPKKPKK